MKTIYLLRTVDGAGETIVAGLTRERAECSAVDHMAAWRDFLDDDAAAEIDGLVEDGDIESAMERYVEVSGIQRMDILEVTLLE